MKIPSTTTNPFDFRTESHATAVADGTSSSTPTERRTRRNRRGAVGIVLLLLLGSLSAEMGSAGISNPLHFSDVSSTAYYSAAVTWASANGITTGVGGSGRFEPNRSVTRAEMVTMIWREAARPASVGIAGYRDVPRTHYASAAVNWAAGEGITNPDARTFNPDEPLQRHEVATMLWRAAGYPGEPKRTPSDIPGNYASRDAISWVYGTGISTGVAGTARFEPERVVTRAEAVTFLWRARRVRNGEVLTPGPSSPTPTTPPTTTPPTTTPPPTTPPTTAPPAPAPAPAPAPGGAATVPSNFDVNQYLMAPWDTPSDMSWQPSGNFRTFCEFSHLAYADPIVAPGNGAFSHLHMFFGNTGTNASSTYQSLRSSGNSTCDGGPLNRTAYWMPAVFDASGNVVTPSNFELYYKAENTSAGTLAQKHAEIRGVQDYPNGLRMIAGSPNRSVSGWKCSNGAEGTTIPDCPVGQRLTAWVRFPYCWDGRNLDSADHRSHMAYGTNNTWGGCPASHPIHLPELTEFAHFDVTQAGTSQWYLSSDRMAGAAVQPNGSTFHADWFGAWDNTIQNRWISNCIRGMKNSSNGNLCDGQQMRPPANYNGPNRIAGYTPSPR